jgi:precorrin-2 dehydrogenase/sirohydrochlorin ferrochelatase
MSLYYPIYLNIVGRNCLVVGGGQVAERKVVGLLDARASVRLVSPEVTDRLMEMAAASRIAYAAREYSPDDLDGCELVFAATNSRTVNALVAEGAAARGVRVNVADAPEEGDFITPAVVRRGDFCLSLTTGGNNPLLSARLADEMEARFGPEYSEFVELLGEVRDTIKERSSDLAVRRQASTAILDHESELCGLLATGRRDDAVDLAWSLARSAVNAMRPGGLD